MSGAGTSKGGWVRSMVQISWYYVDSCSRHQQVKGEKGNDPFLDPLFSRFSHPDLPSVSALLLLWIHSHKASAIPSSPPDAFVSWCDAAG